MTKLKALAVFLKMAFLPTVGLATTFYPAGDRWNPDPHLACYHRDLRNEDLVVAHQTLPCRSRVWLYNPRTHRSLVARVGDRGPLHAMVDLAPRVARLLGANGYERILLVPLEGF